MASSSKTYKVFLSSTFEDLKDHRAHVIRSLRRGGFVVDPMEDWTADSDEPKTFSQDRLAGCDVCVLLVAFRRGFVPEGEVHSITQMEYEAAFKQGAEVLVYQLDDDAKWWAKYDERDKDPALEVWRCGLGKRHGVEFFTDDPQSIDVTSALTRWLAKNKSVQSEAEKIERINWPENKSPYPGLVWFDAEYAPIFFGRDREVDELVRKMSELEGRVLLVIGASGSGKSSVVAAGVWQAVVKKRQLPGVEEYLWVRIQPSDGETPFDALGKELKDLWKLFVRPDLTAKGTTLREVLTKHLDQGQELVLFVDQFEELFTRGFKESVIQNFLEQLISTAQDPTNRLRVVIAIRSEFLGKLETYESTLNLLNSPYRFHLGQVSHRMLEDMIRKPADATKCLFETGLIERIVDDTGQEPGNLPLVAYALKQLFDKRKGRTLTAEAYDAMGGVVGAIAAKADKVLSELPNKVCGAFDTVFAELVHVQRDRPPTRNRPIFSSFSATPTSMQLIEALAGQDCRVLVTNGRGQEAVVEVAHEKLFTAWPKLKEWIDKSGDDLRLIDYVEEVARRWHETGGHLQELWRKERADSVVRALERFGQIPSAQLRMMLKPQQLLVARLEDDALSHEDRLFIGKKLAEFGDLRPGVGVRGGLPDIAWIEIPGGELKLEMVDQLFRVRPFRIAKYPVANQQFEVFLNTEDGYRNKEWWKDIDRSRECAQPSWPEANSPRDNISWYEAVAFCRWLSARTGTNIRLPTEWEWQLAATGGNPQREYPWEGGWDSSRCNSYDSRLNRTTAVGIYPAGSTEQGVLDIAGNVWEWCLNDYHDPTQSEAVCISNRKGNGRVIRGGSWNNDEPENFRASYREWNYADNRRDILGFRLFIGFRLVQDIP